MKKTLLIMMICSLHLTAFTQRRDREQKMEFFKSQKIAFITEKLSLTPKEAEKFWPVYNQFFAQRQELNRLKIRIEKELQNNMDHYDETKKRNLADSLIQIYVKDAKLREIYHIKFKEILPIDKVLLLYASEDEFKTYLLNQIRSDENSPSNKQQLNSIR